MMDKQEDLHGSLIQHGKSNNRIYLMSYHPDCRETLYQDLISLADKEEYGKIFIKVPESDEEFFRVRGFVREAHIPRFYSGTDCIMMGLYLNDERRHIPEEERGTIDKVLHISTGIIDSKQLTDPVSGFSFTALTEEHAEEMAALYAGVFESYPFPIYNPLYLKETMESHIFYFGCFKDGKLAALSSAETDKKTGTVEMTDFAVLPDYRGQNLAGRLLKQMEEYVRDKGFRVAYTIARAVSFGMNKTFANAGYSYGGTLINNTQISGKIESMNVWHKDLQPL